MILFYWIPYIFAISINYEHKLKYKQNKCSCLVCSYYLCDTEDTLFRRHSDPKSSSRGGFALMVKFYNTYYINGKYAGAEAKKKKHHLHHINHIGAWQFRVMCTWKTQVCWKRNKNTHIHACSLSSLARTKRSPASHECVKYGFYDSRTHIVLRMNWDELFISVYKQINITNTDVLHKYMKENRMK